MPGDFNFPDYGEADILTLIAPGSSLESTPLAIALAQMQAVIDGTAHLYMYGWAEYDDVFEGTPRHRTEFCHKWSLGGDVSNPAIFSTHYEIHNHYNGADDECEWPLRTGSPKNPLPK